MAEELERHPGRGDGQVPDDRDVVATHRSTSSQPNASHRRSVIDRPRCEANTGSVKVLIVGWAADGVVSDGWSSSAASSHSASARNTATPATVPHGSNPRDRKSTR